MQPTWTPGRFNINLWILMHWHTCKSPLNTSGRAVEQLAGCVAKLAKVSSQGQSTTAMQTAQSWCQSGCIPFLRQRLGHAHGSTHRMRHSTQLCSHVIGWLGQLRYLLLKIWAANSLMRPWLGLNSSDGGKVSSVEERFTYLLLKWSALKNIATKLWRKTLLG